ncbi:hypothetical protein NQZ68_010108 [Dissostichus eleginoides]|nr:hypothetical protein NQZ68_010108 [Dissostichus eleginoides]
MMSLQSLESFLLSDVKASVESRRKLCGLEVLKLPPGRSGEEEMYLSGVDFLQQQQQIKTPPSSSSSSSSSSSPSAPLYILLSHISPS